MTNCTCTVSNCIHNSSDCCCKSEILIDGNSASCSQNTCCASFDNRIGDSFKNKYETPDRQIEIDCNAQNCVYNQNRKCSASQVNILGPNSSSVSSTECGTFKAGASF